jgi:hypothetical protein
MPRQAVVNLWLVATIVVLIALFALAVDYAQLSATGVQLHNAADAAALASAQVLVDDAMLRRVPGELSALIADARDEAIRYGRTNPVLGRPLELVPNLENEVTGDIVFGSLEAPRSHDFVLAHRMDDPRNPYVHLVNAVRITARRTRERGNPAGMYLGQFFNLSSADVEAAATAMLDRNVIGFRPVGHRPIPLMPIGLFSDPRGGHPLSWEAQVEKGEAHDEYRWDRLRKQFVTDAAGDGLPEMTVSLALGEAQAERSNACLFQLGTKEVAGLCRQITLGVTAADLVDFGEQLVLPPNRQLSVEGSLLGPEAGSRDLSQVQRALERMQLEAEPRLWPLFTAFDPNRGRATVSGFVAARLVRVDAPTADAPLMFLLQPCFVSAPSAVTNAGPQGEQAATGMNRYICKVRLVE